MPTPKDHHDDDPLEPGGPRPADYAEQALLGALLQAPHLRESVVHLEPSHFVNPAHAALFAAIRTLPLPDPGLHAREPVWLNAVLAAARPTATGLGPAYLHQLVQACPRVEHAAAYAQMIIAEHVRRALLVHAEQLALTASDPTLPDPASAVLTQAETLTQYLDSLAGHVAPHAGSRPRTPLPPDILREAGEEVMDEERMLLAAATAHPGALEWMRWLHSDDFASPLHGRLFQCVSTLARRGDPVDPVTVLGQAQHHGLFTADLTPAQLIALLSPPADSPEYWAERILQRALLAQATATARRIHTFAHDPANTPHQLVTGSRRALADLTALRHRWQQTSQPSPAARTRTPRTPATSRAGPSPPRTSPALTTARPAR